MGAKREGVRWSWCVTDRPGRMREDPGRASSLRQGDLWTFSPSHYLGSAESFLFRAQFRSQNPKDGIIGCLHLSIRSALYLPCDSTPAQLLPPRQ
eukprot:1277431-Rhodomonas_salina.1